MPVITRLAIETELADLCGGLMTLVSKPTTPTASPGNASYTGAIAFSGHMLGLFTPATPGTVLDADLLPVDVNLFYPLCDLAEYRLIKSCLLNFTWPNTSTSLSRQDFNDMMTRFQSMLAALEKQYAAYLNIRKSPMRVGPLAFQFPRPGQPTRSTTNPVPNPYPWGLGWGRSDH